MLDGLNGAYGGRFLLAVLGVGLALLVFFVVLKLVRNRAPSPFLRGGRNRQPRLQVLDAAAVDTRRRLVLVRRDDVEHLIMIGGPTDIVIESRIRGASAVAEETAYEPVRDRIAAREEPEDEAYLDEDDDDTTYPSEPAPIEDLRPARVIAQPTAQPAPARPPGNPPLSPAEEWRMRADARGAAGEGPRVGAASLSAPMQRTAAEPSLFPEQRPPARQAETARPTAEAVRPPAEPPRPASAPVRPAPPVAAAPARPPVETRPEPKSEAKPANDFDRIMEEEMVRTLEAAKQQAHSGQPAAAGPQGQPRSVTLQPKRPDVGPVPVNPPRPAAPAADQRVMQQEMARIFGETGDKR